MQTNQQLTAIHFHNIIPPFHSMLKFCIVVPVILFSKLTLAQQDTFKFPWPKGKQAAVSLSFDDARLSQADVGMAFLDKYSIKATFYVILSRVEERTDAWKKAVASGHEIGNHSLHHPCSGNFLWSRKHALEDYNLDSMRNELVESNRLIMELLGVKPVVFAYPCGQKFVGRGINTKSYVPLIAELFLTGRGFLEETPNDPGYTDFTQLTGIEMDGKDFDQILPLLEEARKNGQWVVLAGHEMGESGVQTTRLAMLEKLIEYAQDPANGIWLAPVGTVAAFIHDQRK